MLSFKILEMNRFMGQLLKGDTFDSFLLKEGMLRTNIEYRFQGHLFQEYFELQEQEQQSEAYISWNEIKPFIYELIKGKRTPLAFSFVLTLSKKETVKFLETEAVTVSKEEPISCWLQIRFDHGVGRIITGTARTAFTLDRTAEEMWDEKVRCFLKEKQLPVEEE